jgi:hypothetical protein
MNNNLKLLAGNIIVNSTLVKESKLQLLNFIQHEASEPQIKVFLMDGKIVKLNEETEVIVNERFQNHEIGQFINEDLGAGVVTGSILYGIAISSLLWTIYRVIRATINKKYELCGTFSSGLKKKVCMTKLRLEEATKIKNLLIKNMKECNKQKNPQKCINKHKKVIQKLTEKEKKYAEKLKKYVIKNPKQTVQGLNTAATALKQHK